MTKELQTIQRQVLEKSVSLEPNTAFSQLQGAFNKISGVGTFAAAQIAVGHAKSQGAEFALQTQGMPQKLAPGLTKATAAFNESFNNTSATAATLNASLLLERERLNLERPENISSNSLAQYNAIAQGVIQGTIEGVNPEIRASVALNLQEFWHKNQSILSNSVFKHDDAVINATLENSRKILNKDFKDAILNDDERQKEFSKDSLIQLFEDAKNLGRIDKFQMEEGIQSLKDTEQVYGLVREAREAEAAGGFDFWSAEFSTRDIPDDIKFEAWNIIAKEHARINSQVSGMIEATSLLADLSISKGQFTEEDLADVQNKLPLIPGLKVANKYQTSLNKELTQARNINDVNVALQTNDKAFLSNASGKDISAAYGHNLGLWTDHVRREINNPDYQATPSDKVFVAKQFPTQVPAFTNEAGTVMRTGTPEEAVAWAKAMAVLEENRDTRVILTGLSDDEEAIYLKLSSMVANTDVDPLVAVEQVRD